MVKAPEILSVIKDIPNAEQFLNSLFRCRYADFFAALCTLCTSFGFAGAVTDACWNAQRPSLTR